jgi:hypothetical protein
MPIRLNMPIKITANVAALRQLEIRIPSAWGVNPIKQRNFHLTTNASSGTNSVAKCRSGLECIMPIN